MQNAKMINHNCAPDYQAIYNDIITSDERYNLSENSPGLRAVTQATNQIALISGRSLDVGCGVGFVIEYLSGPTFDLRPFGVDVSDVAIKRSKDRVAHVPGSANRLKVHESNKLPFDANMFSLVTCFDVLEHLDTNDIEATWEDIQRVLRPGGTFLGSVSCRKSGSLDRFGDNLHRTVESVDWWLDKLSPDRVEFDTTRSQLKIWKRSKLIKKHPNRPRISNGFSAHGKHTKPLVSSDVINPVGNGDQGNKGTQDNLGSQNTLKLYQKIYDENPWYGEAKLDRCPGVRLLPKYVEWLISPVMDLGCGRGQAVEYLRNKAMEAEGIDQINNHPDMRVGDITKPIEDISNFESVVCIDVIEHLYDKQVDGLFENMKQVQRQAFSIHNGESTGTGQELHVNRMDFKTWEKKIKAHFEIVEEIQIHSEQILYLTKTKD